MRVSSRELLLEMDTARQTRGGVVSTQGKRRSTVADRIPEHIRVQLERMRREE